METNDQYAGIVLAGGMSRRFGSPKAFEQYGGKAYYELAYEILLTVCPRVMIVTRKELLTKFPEQFRIIVDEPAFKGKGPLAGIYSAMKEIEAENYIVMPCDLPLMTDEVIKYLLKNHQTNVTVSKLGDKIQPLVSIWNKETKDVIKTALENNDLAMKHILQQFETNFVSIDHIHGERPVFMNINTREHERKLRKWTQSLMHSEDQ